MMSFMTASSTRTAGLRSSGIFGARQLFARKIDDVVLRHRWRFIRPQLIDCLRKHDRQGKQRGFHDPGGEHPAVGNESGSGFSGQRFGRAFQSWANGGEEFPPRRRPLDQEFEFVVHAVPASRATWPNAISISSPTVVPLPFSVLPGNSSTEAVCMLTRATRHGFRFCSTWTTNLFGSR